MSISGFFSAATGNQEKKEGAHPCFIFVGGEAFHAVAVGFIDHFKRSTRVHEASLGLVLERFFAYHPELIDPQAYLTASERMNILLLHSRQSDVVEGMALALRQIAVDTIYASPLLYKDVFKDLTPDTAISYLRQTTTKLPASALRALTDALGMKITLSFVAQGQELRRREVYTNKSVNGLKFEIIIQVQGDQFFPQVVDKADFAFASQFRQRSARVACQNETLAQLFAQISLSDKALMVSYEHSRKTLMSLVDAGELNKERLISLYIEFLPSNSECPSTPSPVFDNLAQVNRQPLAPDGTAGLDKEVTILLVDALARWVCTQQIAEERLFDRIESEPESSARPR